MRQAEVADTVWLSHGQQRCGEGGWWLSISQEMSRGVKPHVVWSSMPQTAVYLVC